MRRAVAVVAAGAALVLAGAAPASAHEEIAPATFPTGRPVFLTLTAANEESAPITTVTLRAPEGIELGGATLSPPGWTAARSGQSVTWSGGSLAPAGFEQWGFELDGVEQPGPLRFAVSLGLANGSAHDSQVEVTAVAAGSASPGSPASTPPTESTPTSVMPTTIVGETGAGSGATTAEDRATAALVIGIIAAVLALAALGVALRRRSASAPPAGSAGGQEDQDW